MTTLHLDFESRSTVDLRRAGVYVYAAHPETDVWCAAYAVDDGPVQLWTPGSDEIAEEDRHCHPWYDCPQTIIDAYARDWTIVAHNANFERVMWRHILTPRYGWPEPKLEQWRCTMAMALAMSLPAALENAAPAVGMTEGKDSEGHSLMMRMARPRRPRKGELPGGTYWFDDEERKQRLYAYCRQDVVVERLLEKRLLALRPAEQRLWWLDQVINDRGVYVDTALCHAALKVVDAAAGWLNEEIREITGGSVSATTNVIQIRMWLAAVGYPLDSLDKEHLDDALLRADLPSLVRRVLEIRREAAKAAVKKIDALLAGRSVDGRARGLLQFHAAGTGRWAGRRFQPQNIKRPDLEDVDSAIELVETGNADAVWLVYGEPLSVVGDCLRGMVRASPHGWGPNLQGIPIHTVEGDRLKKDIETVVGNKLFAADFSNIEGRIIAWLAGEEWKLQAFRDFDAGTGHDIYKLAYARSFGIRPGECTKDNRQVGKVMELALGFQGGVGAFQKMASGYGVEVTDQRADELKVAWRKAHPNVRDYWYALEDAAKAAINNRGQVFHADRIAFRVAGSFMFMRLPSGRSICYPYPCIKDKMTPWGEMRPQVSYKGVDTYTRKWGDCFAHGGLLFNNAVQGTARDIEAEAMVRVEAAGYPIVLTVHDEVVCEVLADFGSITEFEALMTELPPWATGLPVAASAWQGERYRK